MSSLIHEQGHSSDSTGSELSSLLTYFFSFLNTSLWFLFAFLRALMTYPPVYFKAFSSSYVWMHVLHPAHHKQLVLEWLPLPISSLWAKTLAGRTEAQPADGNPWGTDITYTQTHWIGGSKCMKLAPNTFLDGGNLLGPLGGPVSSHWQNISATL